MVCDVSSLAGRKFMEELASLISKTVTVSTSLGKSYTGILSGVDTGSMSICLIDVKDESGRMIHKMFINGQAVLQIYSVEKPFDIRGLADRLEKVFPRFVKVEGDVVTVMDRVRVGENGLIEGTGPAAERVRKTYEEFMKEKAKPS